MKNRKLFIVLAHVLLWGIFLSLPLLLRHNSLPVPPPSTFNGHGIDRVFIRPLNPIYFSIITNILMVPLFYLNIFILFPKLIPTKKYLLYALIQLLLIVSVYIIKDAVFRIVEPAFISERLHEPRIVHIDGAHIKAHALKVKRPLEYFTAMTFIFITVVSFSYSMVQENLRRDRIQKEKENETLKSELQFLRWQVSPHFLFNILNNMVALARVKSDKMEAMLLRLSTLMRYMLYETDEHKISLDKEVEYIRSYIELQALRTSDDVALYFDVDIDKDKKYFIEPMLLIPFVENAFKHGVGLVKDPIISIALSIHNDVLNFDIRNRKANYEGSKDDVHGIGLSNVKRRLMLLYVNKYQLHIDDDDKWYAVSLKIDLS